MVLPSGFFEGITVVPTKRVVELFQRENRPRMGTRWTFKNEVRPSDIYCYLRARFGLPNGIQSVILRRNDSDNLIHWDWFLKSSDGVYMTIQGLSFRTEVWLSGLKLKDSEKSNFISQLKAEFDNHGADMGKVRQALEHWIEFVNPYQRLRRAVLQLNDELLSLELDVLRKPIPDLVDAASATQVELEWKKQTALHARALGLCFGIRSMLPVMAEAFVNLLLYVLMKPDLKKDERLKENSMRQPIDVRIKSLSHNCVGFKEHIDYSVEACARYHTIVNARNDLLHGNVVIDKLRFNELYFEKKVPVFIEYSTMWERSFDVAHWSVGLDEVKEELEIVENLIHYITACLEDAIRDAVEMMSGKFDLGLNKKTGHVGVLFPDWVVDFAGVSA